MKKKHGVYRLDEIRALYDKVKGNINAFAKELDVSIDTALVFLMRAGVNPRLRPNPIKVKKGPREYGVREARNLNLTQALEIRDNDYRTRDAQHDYDPESIDKLIYKLQTSKSEKEQKKLESKMFPKLSKLEGKVLWYSERDGHGIIVDSSGIEYYFDSSVIKSKIPKNMKGVLVTFELNTKIKDVRCAKNVKFDPASDLRIKLSWQAYRSLSDRYAYLELPDTPFYNVKIRRDGKTLTVYVGDGYKVYHEKSFSNLKQAVEYAEKEFLKICEFDPEYIVTIKSNPIV